MSATDNAALIWGKACNQIMQLINKTQFEAWFATLKPLGLEQNTLLLGVDNDFKQTWIEENFSDVLTAALQTAADGNSIPFRFVVSSDEAREADEALGGAAAPPNAPRKKGRARPVRAPNLTPSFTFEEYVVGPSNSFAHAAASAVAQAPGRTYNPLFIYGQTGLGKTHLIMAIGHRAVQNEISTRVAYVTSEALLNDYLDALLKKAMVEFRERYRKVDVLLVDDIQFFVGKPQLQEEFFHCFNDLHMNGKQIVMTSDRPAREINGLEQRLVSRFESGLVTELECPDFETRLAILRYKQAASDKTPLPDTWLTFIAQNITSNVRALEGALLRATTFASFTPPPHKMEDLRNFLKDLLTRETKVNLSCDEIQRVVADHFDLRLTDMSSKRRPRSIAMPRQVAMALCRKLTRASLPEIAKTFDKTHATVLHACKLIKVITETDREMADQINTVIRKLGHDPSEIEF